MEDDITITMPDSFSDSSDDGDLQDSQASGNDSSVHNSGPSDARDGCSSDGNNVPTSKSSETEEDWDTEDSDGDEINEDDIGHPGPQLNKRKKIGTILAVKSGFIPVTPTVQRGVPTATVQLKCTNMPSAPAPVSISFLSKSVEWTIYPHGLDVTKEYEVMLGISAKSLRFEHIEKVIFTVNGVEEILEQESPSDKELSNEIMRWKLGTPRTVQNNNRMEMQIGLALKLKPMTKHLETEAFDLHYMELHALGTMDLTEDSLVRFHCPLYNWNLSIRRNGVDDSAPYTISENGDYLAIYRDVIELWDLTNSTPSGPANASATTNPFSISTADLKHLCLSISWDGSQIAMCGENVPFKLYELNRLTSMLEESTKSKSAKADSTGVDPIKEDPTDLATFEGIGSFHRGTENRRQGQKDEIFVAVSQNTTSIYSVAGEWKFLRIIRHTSPVTSDMFWDVRSTSRNISDRIQARHLICRNIDRDDNFSRIMTHSVFVWNLDSGRLVGTIKISDIAFDDVEFLSSDASLLIARVGGDITSFCLRTGVRLSTASYEFGDAVPIKGGNGLFLASDGLIRNGVDFAPIYSSSYLTKSTRTLSVSMEGESFTAYVEGRFSIYRHTWRSTPCNKDCVVNPDPAEMNVWSFIDFGSSLEFSVKGNKKGVSRSLHLIINDLTQQSKPRTMALGMLSRSFTMEATFSPMDRSLVVKDDHWVWVFRMPRRFTDEVSLVSIQDTTAVHSMCGHGRSYFRSSLEHHSSLSQLEMSQLVGISPEFFRNTWYLLSPKDVCLPIYVNRHINQFQGCGGGRKDIQEISMMRRLCWEWFDDGDDDTSLLEQVLHLPECQWVPQSLMEFNPAKHFLNRSKTDLLVKPVFRLILDYCRWRAKSEQNLLFLSPIADCLPTLLDPELPHSKMAILELQRMAFFPIPLRSAIMERHTVIHPPEFRFKFWKPNTRLLFKCREPILQLESAGSSKIVDETGLDTFKDEIFAATFNMIWTDESEPDALNDTSCSAGVPPSILFWIAMAPAAVRFKLDPWSKTPVTCHDFSLDALDNPALSALILYKWSTLGFYLWLTRFSVQCFFYALVLVTAFLQVYAPSHDSITILSGIIGVMSSTFLLLELSQALRAGKRYFESFIYNSVDIAVFVLPLGGCINQLSLRSNLNENNTLNPRGPNSWIYSFSILVVALHLLFELRVNKTVFRFVSAFIRIFLKIRIFFVIFLIGLLAFTAALLHLLHGCVQEPCADLDTNFPRNYYLAFSAVFYFMGGKYDPVSDIFIQPNWAFHTMMIIYLFFTVILMLNILIALINSGYDESDTTWELAWLQNRLFYIESAENLSHSIPGLRQKYDIFPREIYYSLSEAKIQDYKTRWSRNDGLWSKEGEIWSKGNNPWDKGNKMQRFKEEVLKGMKLQQNVGRKIESLRRKANEERLIKLLMEGGRMDNMERQLERIEEILRGRSVQAGLETIESTTDEELRDTE